MPLLFIDMLGVKSRWIKGGRPAAEEAFQLFRDLIGYAIRGETSNSIKLGIIESDSLVIDCKTCSTAINIAKKIFYAAFIQTEDNETRRIWLRGVILPRKSEEDLRQPSDFKRELNINIMHYSEDLLDAITIEKSGYKGMRMLIHKDLTDDAIRNEFKISNADAYFIPFAKLRHSSYPARIEPEYQDLLWMATMDESERKRLELIMALRLRHASKDSEESSHAAATQVIFHEVAAMTVAQTSNGKRIKAYQSRNRANQTLE